VIKNEIAEVWNLPQIQIKITASNNWSYQYINVSAYIGITCNVLESLPVTNFDLELEEPELLWEKGLQDRKYLTWHFRILKLILFPEVHWLTVQSPKNCANKACKTPIDKGQEVSGSLTHGRAKPRRKEPEGNHAIDEVINNKTVKTGCV